MEKRTEFPALEARKSYLERQHYEASQQANDAMRAGKVESGPMLWIAAIRDELDELTYVLRVLGSPSTRIDVAGHTLLIAFGALALIMLAQLAILAMVGR